ncbi:MAG TPA: MBL fold metallo-hydrolase RNA specificity domain-containing protein, partial [Dehalococcoidia bacterium]|nr:MBL fold metallo-hydrolase RNA specificity domain-containing protein [Dehalococcoidia bacterium]
ESTVLFVGYQAQGTLGRLIVDGIKKIRILGKEYQVRAKIVQLDGFSAHADKNDLIHWLKAFGNEPRQIFVTHGETEAAEELASTIRSQLNLKATTPGYLEKVILD